VPRGHWLRFPFVYLCYLIATHCNEITNLFGHGLRPNRYNINENTNLFGHVIRHICQYPSVCKESLRLSALQMVSLNNTSNAQQILVR
jgi:hypothetical protein